MKKYSIAFFLMTCFSSVAFASSPCDTIENSFYNSLGEDYTVTVVNVKYIRGGGRHISEGDDIAYEDHLVSKMHSASGSRGGVKLRVKFKVYFGG